MRLFEIQMKKTRFEKLLYTSLYSLQDIDNHFLRRNLENHFKLKIKLNI